MSVPKAAFDAFAQVYPGVPGLTRPIDADRLARSIRRDFGIVVPDALRDFWSRFGVGSFGEGEIFIYGEPDTGLSGPHLAAWNAAPWRQGVWPRPEDGGPFFFGATAFGDQLGFRYEKGIDIPVSFGPVEMESYRLAEDVEELFAVVLTERPALSDPDRFGEARAQLGTLPAGACYVCDVSPLLTGTDRGPFRLEPIGVHVQTAIAEHDAISKLPPGSKVSKIKLEWE